MPNSYLKNRYQSSVLTAVVLTWLILLLPHHRASSQTQTVSIRSEDGYKTLRLCAQVCVWGYPSGGDLLTNLNCASPWYNVCLCREDLAPAASSFLSKCVNRDCSSSTVDVAQAVSLYDSYCSRDSVPSNVAVVTADSSGPTTTIIAVTTVTSASGGSTSLATLTISSESLQRLARALVIAVATLFLSQL